MIAGGYNIIKILEKILNILSYVTVLHKWEEHCEK